jgi:hypothetical protein
MNTNVIPMVRRLSAEDYTAKRDAIKATLGANGAEASGLRDQALAVLFTESGWTQRELAEKENVSQKLIDFKLRFGRFLILSTTCTQKIPRTLTEGRFRSYWERTQGSNEQQRFAEIVPMIEAAANLTYTTSRTRPELAKAIIDKFADGKWHMLKEMVKELEYPENQILSVLRSMRRNRSWGCYCERSKSVFKTFSYRIVTGSGKFIDIGPFKKELKPLIDQLKSMGHKSMGTIGPGVILGLAYEIDKLIEKYAE